MEQNQKNNNSSRNSGKTSLVTIFGFLFLLAFIGGISLVFIKQNTDMNNTLSTLSAAQSQFMDELAALSSDVGKLQIPSMPAETTDIPIHTLDISGATESSETTTPKPTATSDTPSELPTSSETTAKPEPTTPVETTLDTDNAVQEYVQMWLSNKEYRIPIIPSVPKHNYNWENVKTSQNGLKYYTENGKKVSYEGIDVSSHQKDIDWKKVKAAGIDFAIIRVGFRGYGTGAIVPDEYFTKNIEGALAAGIKVGVYFFSQAINEAEAVEEAELVLEQIKNYNITYPVVYDAEDISNDTARTDGLLGAQITSNCIAFCDKIKAAGYTPMIYANKRWFLTRLDLTRLTDYDLWHAAYVDAPDTPYMYTMWQYSSSGKVDGINGSVDLNISFVDYSKK